jgi:DNA-binding response OmpR family regulator
LQHAYVFPNIMSIDSMTIHPGATILVVDDTLANVGVLTINLEDLGFRVLVARDGEEGLMRARFSSPDLILLDVMMPGLDGFETCRRLKEIEHVKDVPVIFMTALTDIDEKVTGFLAGAVDYVTKPFQMEEVIARINTHLALRRANRDLGDAIEAMRNMQDELVRRETLAALGALVAGVAHEINTPIGTSLTLASTMADNARQLLDSSAAGFKRSTLDRYLADMVAAGDALVRNLLRVADLITKFKQISSGHANALRGHFRLSELFAEIRPALWERVQLNVFDIKLDIPEDIRLDSYPEPLGQVIVNLVDNAVLHGFDGRDAGEISISACVPTSGRVEITVHDDGIGIPPENLSRIFAPFFTTKFGTGGSGLGLHMDYNIVTGVLGGEICVRSEVDCGTTVILGLPSVAPVK